MASHDKPETLDRQLQAISTVTGRGQDTILDEALVRYFRLQPTILRVLLIVIEQGLRWWNDPLPDTSQTG